jgi:tetratricopeptide (TPR) repeat protein
MLNGDWDRAIAALTKEDKDLSAEDYANRAYSRCFQPSKDHRDGNYDDAVADASKALAKGCQSNHNLCIRAYAYYLNNNYEAAITDCKRIIERNDCTEEEKKKDACDKIKAALKAEIAAVADPTDAAKSDADAARAEADKAIQDAETAKEKMRRLWEEACKKITAADKAEKTAKNAEKAAAEDPAIQAAVAAQEAYCDALRSVAFAHELLGLMYANMGRHHEASEEYKLTLLARQSGQPGNQTDGQSDKQTGIVSASPLLMDAYRNACTAVKSMY